MANSPFMDALETLEMINKELEDICDNFEKDSPAERQTRIKALRETTAYTVTKLSPANYNNIAKGEKNA